MNTELLNKVKLAALHLDKQAFVKQANIAARRRQVFGQQMYRHNAKYFLGEQRKLTERLTELYHIWDEVHSH